MASANILLYICFLFAFVTTCFARDVPIGNIYTVLITF